jgi:hypothetical protein
MVGKGRAIGQVAPGAARRMYTHARIDMIAAMPTAVAHWNAPDVMLAPPVNWIDDGS